MQVVILLVAIGSIVWAQPRSGSCSVTLRVVNEAAIPQPYVVMSFRYNEIEYADRFQGLRGKVPCSLLPYHFQLRRSGVTGRDAELSGIDGYITPSEVENWKTVVVPPGSYFNVDGRFVSFGNWSHGTGVIWKGRIKGGDGTRMWINFHPIVPETRFGQLEAEVDADGQFRAHGPFMEGPYILYVTDSSGKVRYMRIFQFSKRLPTEPLEIALPSEPPVPVVLR